MSKFVKVAGVLVVAAGLLAACGTAQVQKVDNTATAPTAAAQQKQAAPATQSLKMGDSVKVNDVTVTVHGVRFAKTFDGKKAAVLDVSFENTGTKPANVSTWSFELVNKDGVKSQMAMVDGTKPEPSGEIAPGRKLRGETSFELGDGSGDVLDLIYSQPLQNGQAIWQINVK